MPNESSVGMTSKDEAVDTVAAAHELASRVVAHWAEIRSGNQRIAEIDKLKKDLDRERDNLNHFLLTGAVHDNGKLSIDNVYLLEDGKALVHRPFAGWCILDVIDATSRG